MDLQTVIITALKASIFFSVFATGLASVPHDALALLERPGQLFRSLLAMNIVMPLIVATVVRLLDLDESVEVALVALSVSPMPPLLPNRQAKAKGTGDYAIGLLVVAAAVAIVFIPLAIELLGVAFHEPVHIKFWSVARLALLTVFIPLGLGIGARRLAPELAARLARPIALVSMIALIVAALPLLVASSGAMWALLGNGTLLAIGAFFVVGLAVGHLLGGPNPHDRSVLALATAARHPAIALTIATLNFPNQKGVMPAILIYVILGMILGIPYIKWRQRADAAEHAAGSV